MNGSGQSGNLGAGRNRVIYSTFVSFVVVAAAIVLTWREEIGLLFNSEGFRPSAHQVRTFFALFAAIWVLTWLLAGTLDTVKSDYERYLAQLRSDSSPPAVASEQDQDARELTVASYQARGFRLHSRLSQTAHSPELWIRQATEPDGNNLHRRTGALIYSDGSATQFSVAVLYGSDVWEIGDEIRVRRNQMGRPVTVRTAIDRPLIRELIQANDYVLGVGLASSLPTRDEERNESLAHARAFNIGYAIWRLNLKDPERIRGVSLGFATQAPSISDQEPVQRSVVLVGVNASRDVIVDDVLGASARLISLPGLNLDQYSRSGASAVRIQNVGSASDYLRAANIQVSTLEDGAWVLPAVTR